MWNALCDVRSGGDGAAAAGGAGGGGCSAGRPGAGEEGPGAGAEDRSERGRAHPRGDADRLGPAQVTQPPCVCSTVDILFLLFIMEGVVVRKRSMLQNLLFKLEEVWASLQHKMCLKRDETPEAFVTPNDQWNYSNVEHKRLVVPLQEQEQILKLNLGSAQDT